MDRFPRALPGLLLLSTALAGFAGPAQAEAPTTVIVQIADYQLINDPLEALGTLRANETVQITANVSDTVSAIHFDDGDIVERGQILVELTDTEERALLAEATARAEEAKRQYQRLEKLVSEGTAARSLLDERSREAATAAAQLEAVQSRLDDRLITAPFSGTVGLRNISPGARVSPGDVITTLVDDSIMKLDFSVPSLYLPSVGRGTPIEATTPVYPGRVFSGTVTSVDSTINPVTRAITVRAVLSNTDHALIPGMLMTLNLYRAERDGLVISESTIVPQGSSNFVWLVDQSVTPHSVQRVQVTVGARQPGTIEILSGLNAGDMVVSHGVQKMRPGANVAVIGIDDGTRSIAAMLKQAATAEPGD